jgi:hypothetical protein
VAQSESELGPSTNGLADIVVAGNGVGPSSSLHEDHDSRHRLGTRNAKGDESSPSLVGENDEEATETATAMKPKPNASKPDPQLDGEVAALTVAAAPARGGRRTFEVLEISDGAGDFDDLHLTEYELEQQHQHEEEGRKLLQPASADSDGRRPGRDESGGAPPSAAGEGPPSPKAPSAPARALHALARALLKGERATAPQRFGNVSVFAPDLWLRTGWGTLGPHWFGPAIVAALTVFSGAFFSGQASRTVGPVTAATCAAFTVATLFHLANAALRDPGVVNTLRYHQTRRPSPSAAEADLESPAGGAEPGSPDLHGRRRPPRRRRERWCDYCRAAQPPDGAHCLDCGVCVVGYDHHCVWMGTCIGASNFRQFVRFNLCWLAFLGYAILWVTLVGPRMF